MSLEKHLETSVKENILTLTVVIGWPASFKKKSHKQFWCSTARMRFGFFVLYFVLWREATCGAADEPV